MSCQSATQILRRSVFVLVMLSQQSNNKILPISTNTYPLWISRSPTHSWHTNPLKISIPLWLGGKKDTFASVNIKIYVYYIDMYLYTWDACIYIYTYIQSIERGRWGDKATNTGGSFEHASKFPKRHSNHDLLGKNSGAVTIHHVKPVIMMIPLSTNQKPSTKAT